MKWINVCDDNYEPIDGQEYVVYLSDGGCALAAYNKQRGTFVEIHIGEEYDEGEVRFAALLTNPWVELKRGSNGKSE